MNMWLGLVYGLCMAFIALWAAGRKQWNLSFQAFWWPGFTLVAPSYSSWIIVLGNVLVLFMFILSFHHWWRGKEQGGERVRELLLTIELLISVALALWLGVQAFVREAARLPEVIGGAAVIYALGGVLFWGVLRYAKGAGLVRSFKWDSLWLYRWMMNTARESFPGTPGRRR